MPFGSNAATGIVLLCWVVCKDNTGTVLLETEVIAVVIAKAVVVIEAVVVTAVVVTVSILVTTGAADSCRVLETVAVTTGGETVVVITGDCDLATTGAEPWKDS